MSADAPDLTVVLMLYNERSTIRDVALELGRILDSLQRPWELLIIDDGSTDGSETIADDLAKADSRIRVIHHGVNSGLGAVYRTGFSAAQGFYVTFFPADGQFPPQILQKFRPAMENADLVLGYLPDRPSAWMSRLLSATERLLYRALLGPMPRFQGIMMFRRDLLKEITLRSDGRGWAVVMEFILRVSHKSSRVISLPTAVRPRTAGRSKVNNVRTITANIQQLARLRHLLDADDTVVSG